MDNRICCISVLLQVVTSKEAKKEHLLCTNLHHFEAVVSCLVSSCSSVSVLHCFTLNKTNGTSKRICVDIVAENGQCWIKVIARNPKALSQLSIGKLLHNVSLKAKQRKLSMKIKVLSNKLNFPDAEESNCTGGHFLSSILLM